MEDYLIIGSSALEFHTYFKSLSFHSSNKHTFINITPNDLDIIYPNNHPAPNLSSKLKLDLHPMPKHIFEKFTHVEGFIDLHSQYILKLSHAEYDINWSKTINHLQLIKQLTGIHLGNMSKDQLTLLNDLQEYWKIVHKKKKQNISLNRPYWLFFKDKVDRQYDHETLHTYVKYYGGPLYKQILKDGHTVLPDIDKWNKLSFEDKLKCAREEIYVIALERFMIPNNMKFCKHEAYRLAYKKLVTTMTKGWFPLFIIDNYSNLIKIDKDYTKIFETWEINK